MKKIKLFGKWLLLTIVYAIIWACATIFFDQLWSGGFTTDESADSNGWYFLLVAGLNMLVIAWYLLRTGRQSFISRILNTSVILFGIQFFQTQIESWWFRESLEMSGSAILIILASGLVTSILTSMFACLIIPAADRFINSEYRVPVDRKAILLYAFLAVVFYPLVYFIFGYYVAWQFDDIRLFYTGSTDMHSFSFQLSEGFMNGLYAFQIFRGIVWILIGWIIINSTKADRTETIFMTIAIFTVLFCSQLLMTNPLMPESVRFIHLIETGTSTVLWAFIISSAPIAFMHLRTKNGQASAIQS